MPLNACGSPTDPTICPADVTGSPGDVIALDVFYMGFDPSDCPSSTMTQAGGGVSWNNSWFTLMNPVSDDIANCVRREMFQGSLDWWLPGPDHGCLPIDPGVIDTIELQIAANTPPGTYTVSMSNVWGGPDSQLCPNAMTLVPTTSSGTITVQ